MTYNRKGLSISRGHPLTGILYDVVENILQGTESMCLITFKSCQFIFLQYRHGASCMTVLYRHCASCMMVLYCHGDSFVTVLYRQRASCVTLLYRHIINTSLLSFYCQHKSCLDNPCLNTIFQYFNNDTAFFQVEEVSYWKENLLDILNFPILLMGIGTNYWGADAVHVIIFS